MKILKKPSSGEQFLEMINREFYNRNNELCRITSVSEILGFVFIQYVNLNTMENIVVSNNGRLNTLFKSKHDLILESNQLSLNLPNYY